MTFAATRAIGGLHPQLPGWTEQLAAALAASGNAHDIRIDPSDRIAHVPAQACAGFDPGACPGLDPGWTPVRRQEHATNDEVGADTHERLSVRWAKLLIVLAAAVGLGSAALLGAHRFLRHERVPPPPPVQSAKAPAAIATSSKGPRLEARPKIVRTTTARAPAGPNLRSSTKLARAKPPRVVPPAPSASSYAPTAPPPAASAAQPPMETPLMPVPETRPTTIDGWMLREVVNGTAVLEGPDGLWRVKRGDTVPGAGQVVDIFSWGNRMIVATSKGLITTP